MEQKEKEWTCPYCGKKYTKYYIYYENHIRNCSKNPKIIEAKNKLGKKKKLEKVKKIEKLPKIYKCEYCGKEYNKYPGHYRKHIRSCKKNPINIKIKEEKLEKKKNVELELVKSDKIIAHRGFNNKTIFNKPLFIKMIEEGYNSYTSLAEKCGCSRQTVKKYIESNDDVKEIYESQQMYILDVAKANIYNRILSGDTALSQWLLKTVDKQFRDKMDVQNDVTINVVTNNKNIDKL